MTVETIGVTAGAGDAVAVDTIAAKSYVLDKQCWGAANSVVLVDAAVGAGLPIEGIVGGTAVPVSGTVTANAGTGTFAVDGSGFTQPVSGTVTADAGTGFPGLGTAGTAHANVISVQGIASGTALAVSGTVTANAGTGTMTVDGSAVTQPVSAASLPLPSGAATAANQPGLGTAGAADSNVITVQGIASMTAVVVDGSAVTQPVSASSLPLPTGAATAANQPGLGTAGAADANVLSVQGIASMTPLDAVVTNGGTFAVQATQSGTFTVGLSAAQTLATVTTVSTVTAVTDITNPVTVDNAGTFATQPGPSTSGGCLVNRVISAATTNATSVKASAGNFYGAYVSNINASPMFLKVYNKASAPTVGTDTPVLTLTIPGNTSGAAGVLDFSMGIEFATGLAFAITGLVADADTTAVAANEVIVNFFYK